MVDDEGHDHHDTLEAEVNNDYNHLILILYHYEKGTNNKDKNIIQDENHDAIINK